MTIRAWRCVNCGYDSEGREHPQAPCPECHSDHSWIPVPETAGPISYLATLTAWQATIGRLPPERQAIAAEDIRRVHALEDRLSQMTMPSAVRGQPCSVGDIHSRSFAAMRAGIIEWHAYQKMSGIPVDRPVDGPDSRG